MLAATSDKGAANALPYGAPDNGQGTSAFSLDWRARTPRRPTTWPAVRQPPPAGHGQRRRAPPAPAARRPLSRRAEARPQARASLSGVRASSGRRPGVVRARSGTPVIAGRTRR